MRWKVLGATMAVVALGVMLSQSFAWAAPSRVTRPSAKTSTIGDPDTGSDIRREATYTLRVPIIRYGDPDVGGGSVLPIFYRLLRAEIEFFSGWKSRGSGTR